MNITLFIILLFGLQIICLIVGNIVSKNLKDQNDYFLAGKNLKFFPLMMTFVATQVGGGLVLGSTEEAFRYGWGVLFYPLGAALGLLLLAAGIGKLMARFQVSTVAQIFEVAYGSTLLKKIASMLSILSLFMIFIAQIIASYKFMLSVGFSNEWLFIGFWAIVIVYTVLGGLKAVVATDILQAIFFIVAFIVCFIFAFTTYSSPEPAAHITSHFEFNQNKLWGWLLMPMLFMVIEQDMAQRCFAAQAPKIVTKATAWAGVITLGVCLIPVFFGILAKNLQISIPEGASVLMTIIQKTTNPTIAAFAGCAIIAAIISTADSLINAISSNLAQDFSFAKQSIRKAQLLTAIIGILGIVVSFYFNNVVDLLIQSYELSVSCLFIPIIMALFKKKCHRSSAASAMIAGVAGFIFFRVFETALPKEVLSILLSLCGYLISELIILKNRQKIQI